MRLIGHVFQELARILQVRLKDISIKSVLCSSSYLLTVQTFTVLHCREVSLGSVIQDLHFVLSVSHVQNDLILKFIAIEYVFDIEVYVWSDQIRVSYKPENCHGILLL